MSYFGEARTLVNGMTPETRKKYAIVGWSFIGFAVVGTATIVKGIANVVTNRHQA